MRNYLISLFVCIFACYDVTQAKNYDSLLTAILARNRAMGDEFKAMNPNGNAVFERYNDPQYYNAHPILADGDGDDFHDAVSDEKWKNFLNELEAARSEATGEPSDYNSLLERQREPIVAMPRTRSPSVAEDEMDNGASGNYREFGDYSSGPEEPMNQHSEVAWQNQLSGEHRVSGGSSELGQWIDYALIGAGAEDAEDDEDNGESDSGSSNASSGEKTDNLPTYCNPPNPCPEGYDPKSLSTPCDSDGVEDSKDFNQHWIWSKMRNGECQCDDEHMRSCPSRIRTSRRSIGSGVDEMDIPNDMDPALLDALNPYMRGSRRKRLVAKKSIQPEHLNRRKRSGNHDHHQHEGHTHHHHHHHQHHSGHYKRTGSGNPYLDGFVLKRVTKKNGRFPSAVVAM